MIRLPWPIPVQMLLTKTFWLPLFGMVEDRFGVLWMINVIA